MSGRTITMTLPEVLYERVKLTAEASARSVEEVCAQSIALSLPELEADLPPEVQSHLAALSMLGDAELENIAHSHLAAKHQEELETLAEVQKQRPLTAAEESSLAQLTVEAQHLMLCKAEAYRLLARRGRAVFSSSSASLD